MWCVCFLALDVLGDFFYTMYHFSAHKIPFLWTYHKTHHEKIHPSAADTFHISCADVILSTTFRILAPIVVLWDMVCVKSLIAFAIFSTAIGVSHHSNTRLARWVSLGFLPGRVYPDYHLQHHKNPGINYGGGYWLWDYLLSVFKLM